jgi:hypothetical protein
MIGSIPGCFLFAKAGVVILFVTASAFTPRSTCPPILEVFALVK